MAMANLQSVVLWSAVAFAVYCALILLARSARLVGRRRMSRRRWEERLQHQPERHVTPSVFLEQPAAAPIRSGPADASEQLRHVMGAEFARRRVMNRGEYRVFRVVELELASNWSGYRVLSQTALGEVIESPDRDAHAAINSKRADVLVIDPGGYPVVALEVQGKAHHGNDAAARDAVKKEALRKAGVGYVEVLDFHTETDITRLLRETLNRMIAERSRSAA
jgi:hypothetical protein